MSCHWMVSIVHFCDYIGDDIMPDSLEIDGQTTVGRVYAVALIQSYFQRFRKRRQERQERQEASVYLIRVRAIYTSKANVWQVFVSLLFLHVSLESDNYIHLHPILSELSQGRYSIQMKT